MKIEAVKPNITKFKIRMERGDQDFGRCMWADILIDHDAYSISAQTDCGDFSHRWPATPDDESFLDLCIRMLDDESYILSKFSSRCVFSLEESKLLYRDINDEESDMFEAVYRVEASNEREWIDALREIGEPEPWEYIVMDYPVQAITFARILKNVVLPELMKEKNNESA